MLNQRKSVMSSSVKIKLNKEELEGFSNHLIIKINNSINFVLENFLDESVERKAELIVEDLNQRGFKMDKDVIKSVLLKNV